MRMRRVSKFGVDRPRKKSLSEVHIVVLCYNLSHQLGITRNIVEGESLLKRKWRYGASLRDRIYADLKYYFRP